jgi:hypothetical protein
MSRDTSKLSIHLPCHAWPMMKASRIAANACRCEAMRTARCSCRAWRVASCACASCSDRTPEDIPMHPRRACRDSGMGPVALVPHGDVRIRTHRAAGSGRGPVEDSGAPGGARVRACAALPRADRSAIAERDGRESRLEECPEEVARLEGRGFALARHCRARTGAPSRNAMAGNPDWRSVRRKNGAPGGIRTPDQRLRKPLLYPAELQARDAHCPRFGRSTRASPIRSALR